MPGHRRKTHISLASHVFVTLTISALYEDEGGMGQYLGYVVPSSMSNEKFSAMVNVLRVQHSNKL